MKTEHIYAPTTFDGSEGLLATIVRKQDVPLLSCEHHGVIFHTDPNMPLQVADLIHPKGTVIEPHVHYHVIRELIGTPEVLFIRKGKVKVDLYLSTG